MRAFIPIPYEEILTNPKVIERFYRCFKAGDGCWIWDGIMGAHGYGIFYALGNHFLAHRVSFAVNSLSDPGPSDVCHSCDITACVNPSHLFLCTHKENMHDMIAKKRRVIVYGERHGMSKLTSESARKVRRMYAGGGYSLNQLAREFSVSKKTILLVVHNKIWKNV